MRFSSRDAIPSQCTSRNEFTSCNFYFGALIENLTRQTFSVRHLNWSPSFRGRFPLPWSKLSSKIVLRLLVGCQIAKVRSRIWFRSLYHLLYCSPIFLATRELFLTRSRSLCRFLLLWPMRIYVASHDRCDVIRQHQVLFSRVESGQCRSDVSDWAGNRRRRTARLPAGSVRACSQPRTRRCLRESPTDRQPLIGSLARPGLSRNLEYICSTDRADLVVESTASLFRCLSFESTRFLNDVDVLEVILKWMKHLFEMCNVFYFTTEPQRCSLIWRMLRKVLGVIRA